MSKYITSKEKKLAIAFIKERYPVGTEIWLSPSHSTPFRIGKTTIFEVFSNLEDMREPHPDLERYEFYIRKQGKYADRRPLKTYWKTEIINTK